MEEIITGIIVVCGSSLLNFVATKLYNYFTGYSVNFWWKGKYPDLNSLVLHEDFEELKRRTRIIVIDDEDSFPISLFKGENYNIEKWDKVTNYNQLERGQFDIIILDIKGVALHISEEDGLGVLESLKKKNPAQIIIAYSQHSYDLSKSRFWEMADEKIAKPSDYLKIKSIIDNLISIQFKPERYIDCLHRILKNNQISDKEIRKLDIKMVKCINAKAVPEWNDLFSFLNIKGELFYQLKTLCQTILNFYR